MPSESGFTQRDFPFDLLKPVVITALSSGHFLKFDGSNWINIGLASGDVPNLDAAKITTGTLPIARGGTNLGAYTSGSIIFFDGSSLNQDNTNLFWDAVHKYLRIGAIATSYCLLQVALDFTGTIGVGYGQFNVSGVTDPTKSVRIAMDTTHNVGWIQVATTLGLSDLPLLLNPTGGFVGVGTTSPATELDVNGSLTLEPLTLGSIPFLGASGLITEDNANLFWLVATHRLGLGTTTPTAKLTLLGTASNYAAGPNVEFLTASDAYPLMQILPYAHDNIDISFDAFWDGSNWKSCNAAGSFQIEKRTSNGGLNFRFAKVAVNSNITWVTAINIDPAGLVGIKQAVPLTNLDVRGSVSVGVVATSANPYTCLATDYIVLCTSGSTSAQVVNLPAATQKGQRLIIKKVDSGNKTIVVTRAGADTIEGATTKTIAAVQYNMLKLFADGTSTWYIEGSIGTIT
jgi:hypothetical protein